MKYPTATKTGVVKEKTPQVANPYVEKNSGGLNYNLDGSGNTSNVTGTNSRSNLFSGSTAAGLYDNSNPGEMAQLTDFQSNQANSNGWSYDQAINSPVDKAGLYEQTYMDSLKSETALRDAQIEDLTTFGGMNDWMDAGSLAMTGIGTAMEMGLYGDRKDYMKNVNASLEQNLQNAEESHNTRQANTASYGSSFSNNA